MHCYSIYLKISVLKKCRHKVYNADIGIMFHRKEYRNRGIYGIYPLPVWFSGAFSCHAQNTCSCVGKIVLKNSLFVPFPFPVEVTYAMTSRAQRYLSAHGGIRYNNHPSFQQKGQSHCLSTDGGRALQACLFSQSGLAAGHI